MNIVYEIEFTSSRLLTVESNLTLKKGFRRKRLDCTRLVALICLVIHCPGFL